MRNESGLYQLATETVPAPANLIVANTSTRDYRSWVGHQWTLAAARVLP
jgi:hypothetical protein